MPPGGDGLLTGKIDRVDTYEKDGTTYFRIVDYKTGRKDFSYTDLLYGKDLQMLLYLFALQETRKRPAIPCAGRGALCAGPLRYDPARARRRRRRGRRRAPQAAAPQGPRPAGRSDPAGDGAL